MSLKHRHDLGDYLNDRDLLGVGVEVGVLHGGFSEIILSKWRGKEFWMVDLWQHQDPAVYREKTDDVDYEFKYHECLEKQQRDPRIHILLMDSVQAAQKFEDESLDWVYIDANHSYQSVLNDMDAWFPKVKAGGLFAGHDYAHDTNPPHWCEVKPAVDRWMAEHGMVFKVTQNCTSWWSFKNE